MGCAQCSRTACSLQVDVDTVVISLEDPLLPDGAGGVRKPGRAGLASGARLSPFFNTTLYCPVTDAPLAALELLTSIRPVLPANGRTIYNGYLFLDGVPPDESGMRHHPVTPMHDASLMRLIDAHFQQTTGNMPA
jgi:hypothetical protein